MSANTASMYGQDRRTLAMDGSTLNTNTDGSSQPSPVPVQIERLEAAHVAGDSQPSHLDTGRGLGQYIEGGEREETPREAEAEAKSPKLPYLLDTRRFGSHIFFGPYIYFPLVAGLTWLGGLLALVGLWAVAGKPRYRPTQGSVVFVSHVAGVHKATFIAICAVVIVFWWASLLSERWLRYKNRLPSDIRRREWVLGWSAIACAFIGGMGLLLLAIFDCYAHGRVHWTMTAVFVIFTALSAICQTGEVWSLYNDHPQRMSLLRSSIFKLLVVVSAVLGAISFAVLYGICRGKSVAHGSRSAGQCNNITSGAAAMEWTIAFILVFYFLSLSGDLWASGKSSPRYLRRLARWEAEQAGLERWNTRAERLKAASLARNRGAYDVQPPHNQV